MELFFRTGCHRREQGTADLPGGRRVAATNRPAPAARLAGGRRGRGSSGSPAPLRGREANARPRHAGLPGPAGRHRAAGPGRARAGPDRDLERHPHPRQPLQRFGLLQRRPQRSLMQQHLRPLRGQRSPTTPLTTRSLPPLFVSTSGSFSFIVDTVNHGRRESFDALVTWCTSLAAPPSSLDDDQATVPKAGLEGHLPASPDRRHGRTSVRGQAHHHPQQPPRRRTTIR